MATVSLALVYSLHASSPSHAHKQELPAPTIEDAISMVRIQDRTDRGHTFGVFSPNGKHFAAVIWRGDLQRDTNVYSLMVLDITNDVRQRRAPRVVLTWDFSGDPQDRTASSFRQLTFLNDNRTIAFLGRKENEPEQVYSVDIETAQLRQLTLHATAVRSYAIRPDGTVRVFSAVADSDDKAKRQLKLERDGVFLSDSDVFVPLHQRNRTHVATIPGRTSIRQYFSVDRNGPTLIFDSRQSRIPGPSGIESGRTIGGLHDEETLRKYAATLTGDLQGRYALMWPYALSDSPAYAERYVHYRNKSLASRLAPYALIDLASGRMEQFIDAPHPFSPFEGNRPVWAPDGRSTLIFTSLPIADDPRNAAQPPQWVEIEIATRKPTPLEIPSEWHVSSWQADGAGVILTKDKGREFAWLPRSTAGRWGPLAKIDMNAGFNLHWEPVTNGKVVIGVKEGLYSPPEFAAFDLTTRTLTVLTDLNPELRQRRYASVEQFRWKHRYDPEASGFLVKPMDFSADERYPLVILLDDGTLGKVDEPYLLDAVDQLNGHAIQMLAAVGFVVLYTREPRSMFVDAPEVRKEGERMREHIESAISSLERAGLVDSSRVGLSGWSRAAYHTNYILIHASHRFAAATQMDGGASEYLPQRPLTDDELQRIRTPLLLEPHGLHSLVESSAMADRLEVLGKPIEVLYFQSAPHETIQPQHRLRSLETHIDWWRFWLLNVEDEDPGKLQQFKRWNDMRAKWTAVNAENLPQAERERAQIRKQDGLPR